MFHQLSKYQFLKKDLMSLSVTYFILTQRKPFLNPKVEDFKVNKHSENISLICMEKLSFSLFEYGPFEIKHTYTN